MTSAGSTLAAAATDRIVVLSKPFAPNCRRAAAKMAALVESASRVLRGMSPKYSTNVDKTTPRRYLRYQQLLNSSARTGTEVSMTVAVIQIGLDPYVIEYTAPDFAQFPGLTAEKLRRANDDNSPPLSAAGVVVDNCPDNFGEASC